MMLEAPDLKTEEADDRQPWHKPEIQRLTVRLDTALGGGSVVDAEGFEFSTPSDRRLKQDITGLGCAGGDQKGDILLPSFLGRQT